MKQLFAAVLVLHGLIHLMGPAKAFRLAPLPQLTQPIAPAMGIVWLIAALLLFATAGALFAWPRWWWAIGAAAIVISQWAITSSWADAKFGAILNAIVLVGVIFGFLAHGPTSLRAQYDADVDLGLTRSAPQPPVSEADLARLPAPVQRFLRVSGVVGQPRVRNVRARMHGRIRNGPDAAWMPFTAEQVNFFDRPSRFFYMTASRMLVPFQGYHRYEGARATMTVKVAAAFTVVGPAADKATQDEMTQAETVTMFNDMCLLAPATLLDPAIGWESIDPSRVRASFTNAGHTIRAELVFTETGELADFWSDDRRQAAADGKTMRAVRWSTPVQGYAAFGPFRLIAGGEARWHDAEGAYPYIQIELDDVRYNVERR
jgi:hypothetical protein